MSNEFRIKMKIIIVKSFIVTPCADPEKISTGGGGGWCTRDIKVFQGCPRHIYGNFTM